MIGLVIFHLDRTLHLKKDGAPAGRNLRSSGSVVWKALIDFE